MAGCDRRCALALDLSIYRSNIILMVIIMGAAADHETMMMSAATSTAPVEEISCACAHCDLTRSLGATIIASLSTLALFGAANWGHAVSFGVSDLKERIYWHIVLSYLNPCASLLFTFGNAMGVRKCTNHMVPPYVPNSFHRSTIAIITNCPILIPIPLSLENNSSILDDLLRALRLSREDDIVSREEVDEICPLAVSPGAAAAYSTSPPAPQLMRHRSAPASVISSSHQQHDNPDNNITLPHDEMKFLRLTAPGPEGSYVGRKALLELGLIPKQQEEKQLRFLRSRNRFQEVVVLLQACGYVLGVALRVFQRLAISPLEAILAILCILITCQTSLSIYACSHFQRPLLLRLDDQQFQQWSQHVIQYSARDTEDLPVTLYLFIGVWVPTILLFAIPTIYYTVPSLRPAQHFYLLCVLSALLFLSYTILMAVAFSAYWCLPSPHDEWIFRPLFRLGITAFFSNIVLALISTIKDWDVFDQRTENSFAWILPHVSPTS